MLGVIAKANFLVLCVDKFSTPATQYELPLLLYNAILSEYKVGKEEEEGVEEQEEEEGKEKEEEEKRKEEEEKEL